MKGGFASLSSPAALWLWFFTMEEVQEQRHSTTYPVVIASIPKATPEPSASEGDKRGEDGYENGEESWMEPRRREEKRQRQKESGRASGSSQRTVGR